MEKNSALYDYTQNLQGTVFRAAYQQWMAALSEEEKAARPQPHPLLQLKGGYAESPAWVMVQMAEFAPEPLTVELFRRRAVYAAPKLTLGLFEMLASEGFLDREGDAYHLTEQGQIVIDRIHANRTQPFVDFMPIADEDTIRLIALLQSVMDASMKANTPPGTWCIAHSRNRAPAVEAPPFAHFIQFGSDLNAFRDDAHMAAQTEQNIAGHVWEAFSYCTNDQAHNAAELHTQLAYRGFYTEDWQAALDELVERDWLNAESYTITEVGQRVRERVEAQTDRYFYAPWAVLSNSEFEELVALMQALEAACQL